MVDCYISLQVLQIFFTLKRCDLFSKIFLQFQFFSPFFFFSAEHQEVLEEFKEGVRKFAG